MAGTSGPGGDLKEWKIQVLSWGLMLKSWASLNLFEQMFPILHIQSLMLVEMETSD